MDALEDIGSIPPGYDRTAFAAIEHAVRHLGSGIVGHDARDVRMVQAMLYRAALLAPDLIPLNYLIASMPESVEMRLGRLPEPAFADAALGRRYVSIMRTQSLAQRVLLGDTDGERNEASETINIHPLVHEILQRLFVREIPAIRLSEQITMMMYFLHGWIAHARRRNQYFVVDQLAVHASALLAFVDRLDGPPTRNHEHARMFLYTKSWLTLEVSTCRMSRGDVYGSVNLARGVLRELWAHPAEPVREALALQAASSIVADLSEAGADASTMRPWALFAMRAVIACESLNANGAALAFEKAYLVRSSLNAREQYREDALVARVIHELDEMIARDPSSELRPNAVMDELVKQIDAGDLGASVDQRLAALRAVGNDYDKHTFDCLEVDIALKRRRFDEAFKGIEELIARPLHQTHGARPLSVGLVHLYRTLQQMVTVGIGPVREMQLNARRVRARAEELHAQIIGQDEDAV